jgi:hypothetical protein
VAGVNYASKSKTGRVIRLRTGAAKQIERSDVTVTRLAADGTYRCYRCLLADLPESAHRIFEAPGDMALHLVDHMVARHEVPRDAVEALVREALR